MNRFRVILLEPGYVPSTPERQVVAAAGGEFLDASDRPLEEALKLCETAEAILVRGAQITPALLRRFTRCKVVVRYGVGVNNVDLAAATECNILVAHVPIYCLDEVTNHAIGLWLACLRHLPETHQKLAAGAWNVNQGHPIWRTQGRALGLVGLGNIGQLMAKKLQGWGLRLLANDPFVEPEIAAQLGVSLVPFETLCRESDYISLHVPLLPETHHLIGPASLPWFKPNCILINTARGAVVDANALLHALNAGKLAAAALDVFEEEPLPTDSPLRRHPKILLSDHMAWYSEESQLELQRTAAEEAVRVCAGGLPRAIANPEVLARLGRAHEWTPNSAARWQRKRALLQSQR